MKTIRNSLDHEQTLAYVLNGSVVNRMSMVPEVNFALKDLDLSRGQYSYRHSLDIIWSHFKSTKSFLFSAFSQGDPFLCKVSFKTD